MAMEVQGIMSANRVEWLQDALKFGCDRFGSTRNTLQLQTQRMKSLQSQAAAERLDGRCHERNPFFDVLCAKAALPNNKGTGVDGIPAEVYRRCRSWQADTFGENLMTVIKMWPNLAP